MPLSVFDFKKTVTPSWGPPFLALSFALSAHSGGSKCPHWKQSYRAREAWQGSKALVPTIHEDLELTRNTVQVDAFLVRLSDETTARAGCLTITSQTTLNRGCPDKLRIDS